MVIAGGCSKGNSPSVSTDVIRSKTAADVVTVLKGHDIAVKGSITCNGRAPNAGQVSVIDCLGTTTDGKAISATLNASTSGKSCTGPMVVNVGATQVDSLTNEKCS